MSEKRVIGTCSICGGPVEQYVSLMIVGPFPPAECRNCGAKEVEGHGRTIPMRQTPRRCTCGHLSTSVACPVHSTFTLGGAS